MIVSISIAWSDGRTDNKTVNFGDPKEFSDFVNWLPIVVQKGAKVTISKQ